MCSKRTFDQHGHPIVIATTSEVELEVGTVFRVLGDTVLCTVGGNDRLFGWLGRSGRAPTPQEQAGARAPYDSVGDRRRREKPPDDEDFDNAAAIEFARLEQQREPTDLLGRIAAGTRC